MLDFGVSLIFVYAIIYTRMYVQLNGRNAEICEALLIP